jgi:hypothetical protein
MCVKSCNRGRYARASISSINDVSINRYALKKVIDESRVLYCVYKSTGLYARAYYLLEGLT